MTKEVRLAGGEYVALVDDADFEWVNALSWYAKKKKRGLTVYAERSYWIEGRVRHTSMHRDIMNAPKGTHIDHINRTGLDNRRANLRVATQRQNMANTPGKLNTSSKYKGASWCKTRQKWAAQIWINSDKMLHLGRFDSEEEAARAYDHKAIEVFGEFAYLNFPE